jgi:hypothetical protein
VRTICFIAICISLHLPRSWVSAQTAPPVAPDSLNKKRLSWLAGSELAAYGITMTGLYQAWYKGYEHSSFHFFDDSKEWLQMDKAGHGFSAYYFNKISTHGFRWCKMQSKNSALWGAGVSWISMASIEVFDGFSAKWGASWTDLTANTGGIILYTGQYLLWDEQRITPKFSFSRSGFAGLRPDALGGTLAEEVIKDYNGQTYWLSFNLKSLTKIKVLPAWLNLAVGYGADEMLGGSANDGFEVQHPDNLRSRQYYLSLDIDFTKINTRSVFLRSVFGIINCLKVPLPTLELSENTRLKGHWIYF